MIFRESLSCLSVVLDAISTSKNPVRLVVLRFLVWVGVIRWVLSSEKRHWNGRVGLFQAVVVCYGMNMGR